jgi:quercetin dioxygenase-like cupin family protein
MLSKHPHSSVWALILAAIATGVLACRDTTTPRQFSNAEIGEPSFTVGVGFSGATVGRGNVGTFHIKSKDAGDYDIDLKTKDNTDLLVTNLAIAAGGHSGWHSHPGPVLVIVKTGAVTLYQADDPTCTGKRYTAGTVFVEEGGVVHIARNEGSVDETMVASSFLPAGAPGRIDEEAPGNCAF